MLVALIFRHRFSFNKPHRLFVGLVLEFCDLKVLLQDLEVLGLALIHFFDLNQHLGAVPLERVTQFSFILPAVSPAFGRLTQNFHLF